MKRRISWNKELVKELMNFFNDNIVNNGLTVTETVKEFAKIHPEFSESQIQVAYYRFNKNDNKNIKRKEVNNMKKIAKKNNVNEENVNNEKKKTVKITKKTGPWSEEENKELLKMLDNRGNKTMSAIFEEYSQKTGRPYKNVSQHHYLITKANKNNKKEIIKPKEIDKHENILEQIKMLPEELATAITLILNSVATATKK